MEKIRIKLQLTLSSTDSTDHNTTTFRDSKWSINRYQGPTKIKAHEKSIPTLTHWWPSALSSTSNLGRRTTLTDVCRFCRLPRQKLGKWSTPTSPHPFSSTPISRTTQLSGWQTCLLVRKSGVSFSAWTSV